MKKIDTLMAYANPEPKNHTRNGCTAKTCEGKLLISTKITFFRNYQQDISNDFLARVDNLFKSGSSCIFRFSKQLKTLKGATTSDCTMF